MTVTLHDRILVRSLELNIELNSYWFFVNYTSPATWPGYHPLKWQCFFSPLIDAVRMRCPIITAFGGLPIITCIKCWIMPRKAREELNGLWQGHVSRRRYSKLIPRGRWGGLA